MIIPRDVSIAVCVILCESGTDLKYLPLITENKNTGLGLGGWGGLGVNCSVKLDPNLFNPKLTSCGGIWTQTDSHFTSFYLINGAMGLAELGDNS